MSEPINEYVEDQGIYSLVTNKTELSLIGMTCANCAMNIEKAINRKVKGIVDASVNFATKRAFVEFVPAISSADDIIAARRAVEKNRDDEDDDQYEYGGANNAFFQSSIHHDVRGEYISESMGPTR